MKKIKISTLTATIVGVLVGCSSFTPTVSSIDSLSDSVFRSDFQRVEKNLKDGIDINARNADGLCPLETAISARDSKMVKYLISQGADVNLESEGSYPPLLYLCYIYDGTFEYDSRHMKVVEHLVRAGVNLKYKTGTQSLIEYCNGENAHPKLIRYLKSKGAR